MRKAVAVGAVLAIAEVALLVLLGRQFGAGRLFLYLVGVGLFGVVAARVEGWRTFTRWRAAMQSRQIPEHGLFSALLVLAAGALLFIPGVITDAMGLLLLLRPVRTAAARRTREWLERRVGAVPGADRWTVTDRPSAIAASARVIDVEARPTSDIKASR